MQLTIDKRFKKHVKGVFEKYEFEVGIIEDKPYRKPARGERGLKGKDVLTTYAGTTVRKATRVKSDKMVSEVSKANRERYDYLQEPFRRKNTPIQRLIKQFFDFAFGRTEAKRLENTLQAVVRNPILSKQYGSNATLTKKIKGFDHVMVDTAQLFKAIRARVRVKNG